MTLLMLILVLIGLAAGAWLVDRAPSLKAEFKSLITYVLLVVAVVVILQFFGVWSAITSYRFTR